MKPLADQGRGNDQGRPRVMSFPSGHGAHGFPLKAQGAEERRE